jgi:hypothetical protein
MYKDFSATAKDRPATFAVAAVAIVLLGLLKNRHDDMTSCSKEMGIQVELHAKEMKLQNEICVKEIELQNEVFVKEMEQRFRAMEEANREREKRTRAHFE